MANAGWPCRPGFFLPVRVLSRLFRRLFCDKLQTAHAQRKLRFPERLQHLHDRSAFAEFLKPLRTLEWVVYAKAPFAGPDSVLTYLSRYTHRVAISNSRLTSLDTHGVSFRYKDYRRSGRQRYKSMTLATEEFIRRFLIHILPKGLHRIRHYGLLANAQRAHSLLIARRRLNVKLTIDATDGDNPNPTSPPTAFPCPACGAPMQLLNAFEPGYYPRAPPRTPM